MRPLPTLLALALASTTANTAFADDPAFKYGDKSEVEKVKGVEWDASAQAGLILTTGNSRTTTLAAGAKASRKQGNNKLSFEANGAYARSAIFLAADVNGNGTIEANEIDRPSTTSTKAWLLKLRYDRFLSERNSLYATGVVSADEPAGKEFVGGGQAGYSRILVKNATHKVSSELGYDFSYEDLVVGDAVSIHSLRGFLGYEGKLSKDTGVGASVEGLFNVNTLDTATGEVGAFEDARLNSTLSLTTKIYEDVSFRFGFTAKFDNAPAPRAPFSVPYAAGFVPLSDELDTKTEATLIINFL